MNLKESSIHYYRNGYNCSQCVLKAAEQVYKLPVSAKSIAMLEGISTGFGIGNICSVLIAGIMIFGLMFDENTVKRLRLRLLSEFKEQHGSLCCCELKNERSDCYYCEKLIGETAEMIEKMIESEA